MGSVSDTGFQARQESYDRLVAKVKNGGTLSPTEVTTMERFEKELAAAGLDLPEILVTIEEVENYTGYKKRTIYKAVKDGDLVRLSDGTFARSDLDTFLKKKGKRPRVNVAADEEDTIESSGDDQGQTPSAKKSESEYRYWRAVREKMQVEQLQGELISKELVEREFKDRVMEFRKSLLLLNRRVSHRVAEVAGVESKLVDAILDEEGRLLLTTLSRKVRIHVE